MKKRRLSIEEYKNTEGSYTIIINNVRYQKNFTDVVGKIVKHFLVDDEVFFGFYRTDGVNLTLHQQMKLEKEIPAFFQKKGEMQELSTYLTVARIDSNDEDYSFIPAIFDYYLETIMFNPEVDWEFFKRYYYNYQNYRLDDIIYNHLAEMLVCYFDSGDLSICFNPQKYNSVEVRSKIKEFIGV
ncbi:MAG: hypothetical protein IJB96_04220 [Lachnospira sp.]|nr:hypothetical protein [Lachnospira sp.]